MNIRIENENDRSRVATLIARTYLVDGADVIRLTGALRGLDGFNSDFALVAEEDEKVEAFILFTKLTVGDGHGLFLAPLAFNPKATDFNISDFIEKAIEQAAGSDYRYIFMLGDIKSSGCEGCKIAEDLDFVAEISGGTLLVKDLGRDRGAALEGKVVIPEILK